MLSFNAALMVALLLNHIPGTQGKTKERLMIPAKETGVSGESMSGKGGFYDGWAGVKQLLQGDPTLVRNKKGHRYSLTTEVCSYPSFPCIDLHHSKMIS